MTSHKFARHGWAMTNDQQRPEGALIDRATKAKKVSKRRAAEMAGISEGRWRAIVNGYQSAGGGQTVTVVAPANTLARMARVVDVSADQLREAERADAADVLLVLMGMHAESDWQHVGSALDRLRTIRDQVDSVIADLSTGSSVGGDPAPKSQGS